MLKTKHRLLVEIIFKELFGFLILKTKICILELPSIDLSLSTFKIAVFQHSLARVYWCPRHASSLEHDLISFELVYCLESSSQKTARFNFSLITAPRSRKFLHMLPLHSMQSSDRGQLQDNWWLWNLWRWQTHLQRDFQWHRHIYTRRNGSDYWLDSNQFV